MYQALSSSTFEVTREAGHQFGQLPTVALSTVQPARFKQQIVFKPKAPALPEEALPFTVRIVRTQAELNKAVQIRQAAYDRHLPEFAKSLVKPEAADFEKGTVVLLAESKEDGSPVGTMRIQTNAYKPLCLEQSIDLPEWLKVLPMAEATRLGVTNQVGGRLVTTALFKAFYMYCQQIGIEWMVIAGRAPVDRMYQRMLFEDVFPEKGMIPLAHASNLPHRVMQFNVKTAFERWSAVDHPLLKFAALTRHPDITLDIPNKALSMPIELPIAPSSTSTFVTAPAIMPIQTTQTIRTLDVTLPAVTPSNPAAANHYAM
jgi:hypothetical protein